MIWPPTDRGPPPLNAAAIGAEHTVLQNEYDELKADRPGPPGASNRPQRSPQ
jgi:hypothetical protein